MTIVQAISLFIFETILLFIVVGCFLIYHHKVRKTIKNLCIAVLISQNTVKDVLSILEMCDKTIEELVIRMKAAIKDLKKDEQQT